MKLGVQSACTTRPPPLCVSLEYSPHAVGLKLSREPPPAALARRCMKVELRCLSKGSDAAHAHSTQPVDGLQRAEELPTVPPAAELVQPPLRANLPNAGIVRGGEHGSFTRGDEASSSMKGCSLCMYLRCVRATGASARDMCSTLPARRVDLRKFTRAVTRMYLLCFDALRVLHRLWTGM